MALSRFYPIKLVCGGCGHLLELQLAADNSDPSKGLSISEDHYAECRRCELQFFLTMKRERR